MTLRQNPALSASAKLSPRIPCETVLDEETPSEEMKASHGLQAPSKTLLRFLRCQLDAQSNHHCPVTAPPSLKPRVPLSRQCRALSTNTGVRVASAILSTRHTNHDRQHVTRRDFGTVSSLREGFWRRLRPSSGNTANRNLRQDDLPPLQGFLEGDAGLGGRIVKPSNELKLRCTEFDENGNVTLVNGEFRKHELIAKVGHCVYAGHGQLADRSTVLPTTT